MRGSFKKGFKSPGLNFFRSLLVILLLGFCLMGNPVFTATVPLAAGEEIQSVPQTDENPPANTMDTTQAKVMNLAVIFCTEATIIPTAGALDFYKTDTPWIIRQAIQIAYPKEKFFQIPSEAVALSLNKFGYDVNALEMPGKDDIIKIAADLNADAILAIELSSLGVTVSRTSYQYHAIVRYRAYQASNNRLIIRQFLNEGPSFSNKSTPKEQKDKLIETIRATVNIVLSNCLFGDGWE